jgi:hypothetical protein
MGKRSMAKSNIKNPVYTLEVELLSGPTTEEFWKKNPTVMRKIQIRAKQKLAALHQVIYDAFDRGEEHMYEFQVGGKKPGDRSARRYSFQPSQSMMPWGRTSDDGDVQKASIGDLGLAVRQAFFYWFDFGDDWWHKIKVVAIDDAAPPGKYPQITERVGASPPQYLYEDEEDEDWDEDVDDDDV